MTPAEHYLAAGRALIVYSQMSQSEVESRGPQVLALAQFHATMATVSHATYNDALGFAAYAQREPDVLDVPRYEVGDPDPTYPPAADSPPCLVFDPRGSYGCTWRKDHDHPQHVAGTSEEIVAVWPVDP